MNPIVLSVLGVSALLAAISIVVPLARRLMLPYTLVLGFLGVLIGLLGYLNVGSGLGGDIVGGLREIGLLDDAFIYIYLPPLLFAAGLTVGIRSIVEDIWHVILLAVVAVMLTTLAVGYSLALVSGMLLLPCLLLGTIVSTTDTAAVVNIFREIGVPKRLSSIVEGEALFNDAAAIAIFGVLLDMVTRGARGDLLQAGAHLMLALAGGAAFGYAAARVCFWLISLLKDTMTTEVTLTISFAYFTFVVGNQILDVSGVVATVTLAIAIGSYGRTRLSPGSWEALHKVWEHLDFWATSLIFVTSAMYVPRALNVFDWADAANVAVVFVAALAARAAVIWGMMPTFSALGASRPLSNSYKVVLWWGGMRGAVTIALALATTATDGVSEPVRHLIASAAVGYVIASLVLNGLTLRPLMNVLRLDKLSAHDRALRSRILQLTRRRIHDELGEAAAVVGHDPVKLSRSIVPGESSRGPRLTADEKSQIALSTWCHREIDFVLSLRERGVLTRHHADMLRVQADRLIHALKNGGVDGYRREAQRLREPAATQRLAFWIHRHVKWEAPVIAAVADRLDYLFGDLLVLREMIRQAKSDARKVFGKVAIELFQVLQDRARIVEDEILGIEDTYPDLAKAVRSRHLALVALGMVEAEYRRHLSDATITVDVFEDLDARRRAIAARFAKRPKLDIDFNVGPALARFPVRSARPAVRAAAKPYIALPGHRIALRGAGPPLFFIVSGQVEVQLEQGSVVLHPGEVFGLVSVFEGCKQIVSAITVTHVKMLKIGPDALSTLRNAAASAPPRVSATRARQSRAAAQPD